MKIDKNIFIFPFLLFLTACSKELIPSLPHFDKDKPTVGILLGQEDGQYALHKGYVDNLLKRGLNIQYISYESPKEQVQNIDCLLLVGGSFDSPPQWYIPPSSEYPPADNRYLAYKDLIQFSQEQKLPTLGICAGMQMMTVEIEPKAKIYVSLSTSIPSPLEHRNIDVEKMAHSVYIKQDSLLYKILKKDKIEVNSSHNQSIVKESLSNSLRVNPTAISLDGVIEAVEFYHYPYFLGLQWHPERLDNENSKALFDWFATLCIQNKK